MITYSNIKAYNQIWSPMGRYPMIDNSQFETYQEALTFATTNAVAVVGSIITVTNDPDTTKRGVYELIYTGEAPLTKDTQPTGIKRVGADIDLSNYVTKDQLTSIYTYKGSKATFAELPVVDVVVGDVWNVEEAYENHPAGTNWVWDGENWDALAGSVDLSGYALKADVEASVATLTGNIATNTGAIAEINTALANKVEKVEGSSLITTEKLELIDTNAEEISALKEADTSLDARLKVVEGAFKGEGGEINLGDLTTQLTDHGTRIVALEGANTTNQANITTLQGEVSGHSGRLTAIETLNTEQGNQISGLTTRVENVEKHGEAITNLTTLINGHTESISTLTTDVADAKALAVSEAAQALLDAKDYADGLATNYDEAGAAEAVLGNLNAHIADTTLHVTQAEREAWNEAKDAIDAFLKDAEFDAEGKSVVDTLKELQTYMSSDGEAATLLVNRVSALEAIDHDAYKNADTALETSLQSYVDGKIELLGTAAYEAKEAFATAAQGALAETAAQQATTYTKTEVDTLLEDAFSWINIE